MNAQLTTPHHAIFEGPDMQQRKRNALNDEQIILLFLRCFFGFQDTRHVFRMWDDGELERELALSMLQAMHCQIGEALHGAGECAVDTLRVVLVTAGDER